jgi:uncharacterized protein YbcI
MKAEPTERNMVKAGEHQRLRELRMYFQHSSEKDFIEAIEQITGRKVRGFTSGVDGHRTSQPKFSTWSR